MGSQQQREEEHQEEQSIEDRRGRKERRAREQQARGANKGRAERGDETSLREVRVSVLHFVVFRRHRVAGLLRAVRRADGGREDSLQHAREVRAPEGLRHEPTERCSCVGIHIGFQGVGCQRDQRGSGQTLLRLPLAEQTSELEAV